MGFTDVAIVCTALSLRCGAVSVNNYDFSKKKNGLAALQHSPANHFRLAHSLSRRQSTQDHHVLDAKVR